MKDVFLIDQQKKLIIGLNKQLKCLYVYNRFLKTDESIIYLTNSLYEATTIYQNLLNYTDDVLFFPMDDFLISEVVTLSPDLKITRLETIKTLLQQERKIVVVNLMGFLRFMPPTELFFEKQLKLAINKNYNLKQLGEQLEQIGYKKEVIVNKTGDFAMHGNILDVFPLGEETPYRLNLIGEQLKVIKTFDVDTQRTITSQKTVEIFPNTEFLIPQNIKIERQRQSKLIKYLQPISIIAYLNNCKIIIDNNNNITTSYKKMQEEILSYQKRLGFNNIKYMHNYEDLKGDFLYLADTDSQVFKQEEKLIYTSNDIKPFPFELKLINKQLNQFLLKGKKVIVCLSDHLIINKLVKELNNNNFLITTIDNIIAQKINLVVFKINSGFEFQDMVVISENELLNKSGTNFNYKTRFKMGTKIKDLSKIEQGDYVVHSVYGISRYIGLKTITKNLLKKDYLCLEFRDGDLVYVPVEKLETIKRYSTNNNLIPKLSKLGTLEWAKTKKRIKDKIEDLAGSLLELYAKREISQGFAFLKDNNLQTEFERQFIHTDTLDQRKVTEEIKRDMEKPIPMDRLLCGDVGFGKTEVAFRAMFKAVLSNKQVAFLCPTTILSIQHYNNALERFRTYPLNIKLLNRFVSPSDIKQILKDLKEGKIDILIGTHRLLSADVIFKDLGLLVVDEEQRFGVKHKEKLKEYKNNIDILTLTATPIPRTLQMTLTNIRSLSLIQTPPVNRYPIQTYVLEYNKQIIKEAIYKEWTRNGQSFILYNNIDSMSYMEKEMQKLMPDLKIVSAHGRMSKTDLEKVMMKFYNYEYDVLICTTIIETGIDIPNVNTLIIINADYFGLSQLYQIRGRVGRDNKIAYCYLMYNGHKLLNETAVKRLNVIKNFTELGSGFSIALRDLSIRGAGDILGSEQAGFIDAIGIEMFLSMLETEIKRRKGEVVIETKEKDLLPKIEVNTSIKDDYILDEEIKIAIHQKINLIDNYEKLIGVKDELEDRFGKVDEELLIYMYQEWFEKFASDLKIDNILQTKNFIEIEVPEEIFSNLIISDFNKELKELSPSFRLKFVKSRLLIILDLVKLDTHFIYYLLDLLKLLEKKYLKYNNVKDS